MPSSRSCRTESRAPRSKLRAGSQARIGPVRYLIPFMRQPARRIPVHAAQFFGLILWNVFRERADEYWAFGRYKKGDIPIAGLTYFRVDPHL